MSKVLEASCVLGVVSVGGVPVVGVEVLSEGVGASDGLLIIDQDEANYLTSNASDLKTTIEKIASTLTTIASALTSIGTQMLGPATAPPPTLPANVASITAVVAELAIIKETLK